MVSGVGRSVVSVVGGVLMVGACRWLAIPCYRVGRCHPVGEGVVHPKYGTRVGVGRYYKRIIHTYGILS